MADDAKYDPHTMSHPFYRLINEVFESANIRLQHRLSKPSHRLMMQVLNAVKKAKHLPLYITELIRHFETDVPINHAYRINQQRIRENLHETLEYRIIYMSKLNILILISILKVSRNTT